MAARITVYCLLTQPCNQFQFIEILSDRFIINPLGIPVECGCKSNTAQHKTFGMPLKLFQSQQWNAMTEKWETQETSNYKQSIPYKQSNVACVAFNHLMWFICDILYNHAISIDKQIVNYAKCYVNNRRCDCSGHKRFTHGFEVISTCFRSCWTIPRSACSSQMRRYKQIICWPRRNRWAMIYSQWSVHNLKIRHERFLMVLVKYWSIELIRTKCCNENIGLTD